MTALVALLALLVAGCGGGGSSSSAGGSSATASSTTGTAAEGPATAPAMSLEPDYVDWPYFGRVPQRTHYLPTKLGAVDRPLDPPLKQAWSINTHGLLEFPPAIGDRVA
jgi:ABC-type phosphate transport system substrate-binding protein